MTDAPLVSVIIPCFRQARFLRDAVQSVLRQTVTAVEAVVIDDGSPDEPRLYLGELAEDHRVKYFRQENAGLGAARNAGVNASRGTFLNFLDADDWLAPKFCERMLPALPASHQPGFVYCDMHHVFEGGQVDSEREQYSVGKSRRIVDGNILPSLLLGGYFSPQTVLVRRAVLDRVALFDPDLGGHADWDLWLRISASGYEARYVDEKLVYYRIHGDNMSANAEHMRSTRIAALRKLFRTFPEASADAAHELCRTADEMFAANRILQSQLGAAEARAMHCAAELARKEASLLPFQSAAEAVERLKEIETSFNQYFRDSQAWIASVEEAKRWHEQQSEYWKREAERLRAGLPRDRASE